MDGKDEDAKRWLDHMADAIAPAIRAPYVFKKVGAENAGVWASILKLDAARHAIDIGEEAHADNSIFPAIDIAIPVK